MKNTTRKRFVNVPTPFSKEQIIKLFEAIDNPKVGLASFLALRTGMRITEVLSIRVSDIDWELKRIVLEKTKNNKPRTYLLDNRCMDILKRWIMMLNPNEEYLFPSHKGTVTRTTRNGFYNEFKVYLDRAGFTEIKSMEGRLKKRRKLTFHSLRTTFCSFLVNAGVEIYTAKELMGHSKVSTTERYYCYLGAPIQREALNRVFGKKEPEKPIQTEYGHNNPLEELNRMLIGGELSTEDYKAKSEAILSVMGKSKGILVEH